MFDSNGHKSLDQQLRRPPTGSSGLLAGESLLLYGAPGSLKTVFGFNFLRLALNKKDESCLFVSFKIDERALTGIAQAYLAPQQQATWRDRLNFIDARNTYWTPARVLAEIREIVLRPRRPSGFREATVDFKVRRAVVFGLSMMDKLPAFQGQELTFLQILVSYFESQGITGIFIDWPQEGITEAKLRFESIVNYFSTTITISKDAKASGKFLLRVKNHQFRVNEDDAALRIDWVTQNDGTRQLVISQGQKSRTSIKVKRNAG